MAIKKLVTSSSINGTKNSNAWDGVSGNYGLVPLSWTSLSSTQTTIDLQNIPQGYTNLRVVMCLRNTGSNYYSGHSVTFNNNTTSIYSQRAMGADGSIVYHTGSFGNANNSYFYSRGATSASNLFGVNILDIPNYSSTTVTKTYVHDYFDNTKSRGAGTYFDKGFLQRNWAHFDSTAAIERITINGTFAANSTVGIYGYKKYGA